MGDWLMIPYGNEEVGPDCIGQVKQVDRGLISIVFPFNGGMVALWSKKQAEKFIQLSQEEAEAYINKAKS